MVQITEAIFTDGVLKPVEDIDLAEGQRVRLVVEPIDNQSAAEASTKRAMALEKLLAESKECRSAPGARCLPGTSCMTVRNPASNSGARFPRRRTINRTGEGYPVPLAAPAGQ